MLVYETESGKNKQAKHQWIKSIRQKVDMKKVNHNVKKAQSRKDNKSNRQKNNGIKIKRKLSEKAKHQKTNWKMSNPKRQN